MFQKIGFFQVMLFAGILAAIYYIVIMNVFSKKPPDSKKDPPRRKWEPIDTAPKVDSGLPDVDMPVMESEEEERFFALERLADEMEGHFQLGKRENWPDIKAKVQQLVATYPELHADPYRKAILTHLLKCGQDYWNFEIPQDSLSSVWVK